MLYCIENNVLSVSVDTKGAELASIIHMQTGREYLYDGKGAFWNERAPILFPFVGRLKDGIYRHKGEEYDMPIHGFARFREFTAKTAANELLFTYAATADDQAVYPFDFSLAVRYKLTDNTINVSYTIENTGSGDMYFSIGAHPGFRCPFTQGEAFSDYYLEFEQNETADIMLVTKDGLFSRNTRRFLTNGNTIPLNYNLFADDALVFAGLKSKYVTLKSKNRAESARVDFSDFKYLGIWTVPGAEFICIEPWNGHGDYEDFSGDLPEKPGIIKLNPGGEYTCGYNITISP